MKPIDLSDISKYRAQLMGFAIIIVMLFHVDTPRGDVFFGLRRMGNLGVDIFFFLSGIGLWYSWTKRSAIGTVASNYRHFYLNRALRIYPTWLIIAGWFYVSRFNVEHPSYSLPFGGTGIAQVDSWIDLVGDVLFNWDFWLHDELTFWYVPATMMLYIFAPPYMQLIRRWPAYRWLVVLPLMWCIVMQYVTPVHQAVGHIEIFWSRVPIFFLGINCAEAVRSHRTLEKEAWPMIIGLFVFSLWACIWLEQMRHGKFPLYTERMLYIVLAITTILIMTEVFAWWDDIANKGAHGNVLCSATWLQNVNRFLSWVGGISLEIYLIHIEFVMRPLRQLNLSYWPTFLCTFVISLPLAWLVSKICNVIIKYCKTKI